MVPTGSNRTSRSQDKKMAGIRKKVRYKGETVFLSLTNNKIYDVLSVERSWYRIVDDSGEDYLYPPEWFEEI